MAVSSISTSSQMDLSLSENQRMIADMIRKFGEEHIKPYIREWDESQHFPVDCMKKLGELGLLGIFVPSNMAVPALAMRNT
jgi:alkylation response protein AidB-like acyl-CoA dehydrogenase